MVGETLNVVRTTMSLSCGAAGPRLSEGSLIPRPSDHSGVIGRGPAVDPQPSEKCSLNLNRISAEASLSHAAHAVLYRKWMIVMSVLGQGEDEEQMT